MAPRHSRHGRFLVALGLGIGLFGLIHKTTGLDGILSTLAGFNGFALGYLLLMVHYARATTGQDLRRHAADGDEGAPLILVLAVAAVTASVVAVLVVVARPAGASSGPGDLLALAAVPLGWAVVQTLAAFRYAHLHYATPGQPQLTFPGTEAPAPWDFLYFAFTIGMTAQTSDVVVTSGAMRRMVLAHAVLAFFYNTVIIALAVNAALTLAS